MSVRVIATVPVGIGGEELDLWQLTGLQRGDVPEWFQEIVDRDYDGSFRPRWFDHPAQDGESLIVEPYEVCHSEIREIVEFADKYSLNVSMSAISQHFPTRTISVSFMPREAA
jgi:hypothetical protein